MSIPAVDEILWQSHTRANRARLYLHFNLASFSDRLWSGLQPNICDSVVHMFLEMRLTEMALSIEAPVHVTWPLQLQTAPSVQMSRYRVAIRLATLIVAHCVTGDMMNDVLQLLYDGKDGDVIKMLLRIHALRLIHYEEPLASPELAQLYKKWLIKSWQWGGKPGNFELMVKQGDCFPWNLRCSWFPSPASVSRHAPEAREANASPSLTRISHRQSI